jgi:hypothetical protein
MSPDTHHISDTVMILNNDEKSADDISDNVLRPETDRKTHHPRRCEDRRDIDADIIKRYQKEHDPENHGNRTLKYFDERLFTLLAPAILTPLIFSQRLMDDLPSGKKDELTYRIRKNDKHNKFRSVHNGPIEQTIPRCAQL